MAVAFTNDTDQTPTTSSSIVWTGFVVSGANPVIVLGLALDSTTATVVSVVCSAGLTSGTPVEVKALRSSAGTLKETYVSIWTIPAPTGTGTITVTLSASVPWQATALLLSGADQTTPCPLSDAVSTQGNANPLTLTPTNLTAADAVVGFGANAAAGDAPVFAGTAETYNNNTSNVNAAGGYSLGTGAVTCTWGNEQDDDVFVAVRVVAVGGGGGATVALEWKAPAVQLVNHHHTSIINMRATAPAVVPYLRTTATRVTNPLDWVTVTPDVIWTDG